MNKSLSRAQIVLSLWFLAMAGAGAAACVYLLSIPSDMKNAFILGFSIQRLLLLLFVMLPSGWALYTGIKAAIQKLWVLYHLEPAVTRMAEGGWFNNISGALFILGWLAAFIPPYWFGISRAYYVRLRPDLIWLGFCFGLSLAVLWIWKKGWRPKQVLERMRLEGSMLKASLIAALILFVVWASIAVTGLGIKPDALFWNEAGAPLLGIQLILCLFIVVVFRRLIFHRDSAARKIWIDWIMVGCIWVEAFLLWQFTPMPYSYNAPGPYPPNNIYYPYADAEAYDTAAQYLLMGHGLANGDLVDKPVYALILAGLHLIAGQNYTLLVTLQVALMAFLPVGLYLLGKSIGGRETGLLTALFAIFQQRNAIAATVEIQVATSKLLLSEYPGALALIFLCLVVVRWFQAPETRPRLALVGGGLLGIVALIRPNALILLPILLILILVLFRKAFKRGVLASGLFALTFLAVFVPWNLVIPRGMDYPYLVFKAKALFESRYQVQPQSTISPDFNITPINLAQKATPKLALAAPVAINFYASQEQVNDVSLMFIPRHYFHNEIMAFLILPHSVELQNLAHTLQAPYWQNITAWDGQLPLGSVLLLTMNVVLVGIGIGFAWKRWRLSGLVPLTLHITYYLANAIVRNSGARYLVPVDWVLLLYYALGILQLLSWLRNIFHIGPDTANGQQIETVSIENSQITRRINWKGGLLFGMIFLVFGSCIPLSRYFFPYQFPVKSQTQILTELQSINWQDARVSSWLTKLASIAPDQQAGISIIYGRGLYPRFYEEGKSEPGGDLARNRLPAVESSRLTLRVLAPDYPYWAILPMDQSPSRFIDGAKVAVIGCAFGTQRYTDAAAILVMTDPGKVYWRSDSVGLNCQLPVP